MRFMHDQKLIKYGKFSHLGWMLNKKKVKKEQLQLRILMEQMDISSLQD